MKMMPVLSALDADGDGYISKEEIDNAAVALRKLDKNDDGRLDFAEMRPSFAGRGPEGQGPGMRGGRGGFRGGERDGEARDGERRGPGAQRRPEGDRPRGDRDASEGPQEGRRDGAAMAKRLMQLDKDGNGELTADELPERAKGMLDRLDRDKSGSISKEELDQIGQRGPRRGDRE
jgi:Ca2+-binding EF-hand superfamily protein